MTILGIDPGTGRTGWGVIRKLKLKDKPDSERDGIEYVSHGCIITHQDDPMQIRLKVLYENLCKIIQEVQPDCIIVERIFFGRNTKTAISVSQARGVVMLATALSNNVPMYEYTSISVKHHLSGHGRTDKKEIQKIVRHMLSKNRRKLSFNTKDKGFDDAADALAIAIYHATIPSRSNVQNAGPKKG